MPNEATPPQPVQPTPANITISRVSSSHDGDYIRVRLDIGREVIEVSQTLSDFTLTITGRSNTPAMILRRFHRP